MNKPIFACVRILVPALLIAGCAQTHELAMNPPKSIVVDDSAGAPESPRFKRIMLVLPPGRARADLDADIALIERELIRNGATLLTPYAAGNLATPGVVDAEGAISVAKQARADAILEISQFGVTRAPDRALGARFFAPAAPGVMRKFGDDMQRMMMIKSGNTPLVETDEPSLAKVPGDEKNLTRVFEDDVIEFTGRLVDVNTREVVVSLHFYAPGVRTGRPYFEILDSKGRTTDSAYDWTSEEARRLRRTAARKAIVTALADRVAGNAVR